MKYKTIPIVMYPSLSRTGKQGYNQQNETMGCLFIINKAKSEKAAIVNDQTSRQVT